MEMELPPRERAAKADKIISLQSILMRQLKVDERGLPLSLDEAVEKERVRATKQELAMSHHLLGLLPQSFLSVSAQGSL